MFYITKKSLYLQP